MCSSEVLHVLNCATDLYIAYIKATVGTYLHILCKLLLLPSMYTSFYNKQGSYAWAGQSSPPWQESLCIN